MVFWTFALTADITIDDFSDGDVVNNLLGGANSFASMGTSSFTVSAYSSDSPGGEVSDSYCCKIDYTFSGAGYFYFQFNFPAQSCEYYDYLEFYFIRDDNMGTSFDLWVKVYDGTSTASLKIIANGYCQSNPALDQWHRVGIPLGDFIRVTGVGVDLSNLQRVEITLDGSAGNSGTLYIDDFRFRAACIPDSNTTLDDFERVHFYPSDIDSPLVLWWSAGATVTFEMLPEAAYSGDYGLKVTYTLPAGESFSVSHRFHPFNAGFSTKIVFYIFPVINTGSVSFKIRIKDGTADGSHGAVFLSFDFTSKVLPSTWQKIEIPLAAFLDGVNTIDFSNLALVELSISSNSDASGYIYYDCLGFAPFAVPQVGLLDDFSDGDVDVNVAGGRNVVGVWPSGSYSASVQEGALKLDYTLASGEAVYFKLLSYHLSQSRSLDEYLSFEVKGAGSVPDFIIVLYDDANSNNCYDAGDNYAQVECFSGMYIEQIDSTWRRVVIPLRDFYYLNNSLDFSRIAAIEFKVEAPANITGSVYLDNIYILEAPTPTFPFVVDDFEDGVHPNKALGSVYFYNPFSAASICYENGSLRIDYNLTSTQYFAIAFNFRRLDSNPSFDPRFFELSFKIRGSDVQNFWVWLTDSDGNYYGWQLTGSGVSPNCPFSLSVSDEWTNVRIHFKDFFWPSELSIKINEVKFSIESGTAQSGTIYIDDIEIKVANVFAYHVGGDCVGIYFPSTPNIKSSDIILKDRYDESFAVNPVSLKILENLVMADFENLEEGKQYYLEIKSASGEGWTARRIFSCYEPEGSNNIGPYLVVLSLEKEAEFILNCQLEDGAYAYNLPPLTNYSVWICPYFGGMAAIALCRMYELTGKSKYVESVKKWLYWYVEHMYDTTPVTDWHGTGVNISNPEGLIDDYKGPESEYENYPVLPDSTDAYPAIYLWAMAEYYRVTGDIATLKDLYFEKEAVRKAIHAMELTLDLADGLTWARPDYPVKYFLDNAEVVRGCKAAAFIAEAVGDDANAAFYSSAASFISSAIVSNFWDASRGYFGWAKDSAGTVYFSLNMFRPYPDLDVQMFYYYHVSETNDSYFQSAWQKVKETFYRRGLPIMEVYSPRWWIKTVPEELGYGFCAELASASLKIYNYWHSITTAASYIMAFSHVLEDDSQKVSLVEKGVPDVWLVTKVITPNKDGVNDTLVLETQNVDEVKCLIVDLYGNVVKRKKFRGGEISMKVEDLPAGVYLLRVKSAKISKVFKFAVYR